MEGVLHVEKATLAVLLVSHSCVDLNVRAYMCLCRQPLPNLPVKNFTHLDLKLRQLREEERVRRNGPGGWTVSCVSNTTM